MKISVVGTGYVGLVSGACLAERGHEVVCVDIDPQRVADINAKIPPIHEDGLPELLEANVGGRLTASTDLRTAVLESELSLIAVGTPYRGDQIDLQFIEAVSDQIGEVLADKDTYHVVVVKSTVVPGTTEDVVLPRLEKASGKTAGDAFGVGMNPEFLREGVAIPDFMDPDRIVLGGIDQRTLDVMAELYAVFPDTDKLQTTPRTAEMIKYTANSLLATLISFSNEIANICSAVGDIDVTEVQKGVHLDHRFNPIAADGSRVNPAFLSYLEAGCGFGGSCFPKDVKALVAHGRSHGYEPSLVAQTVAVNETQPRQMVELLRRHLPDLAGRRVTVLGVAFKPDTDDVRESPALPVLDELLAAGAVVTAHDPIALPGIEADYGDRATLDSDLDAALDGAEAVLLITTWRDYADLADRLSGTDVVLVDGRRAVAPDTVPRYEGIGRG